MNLNIFKCVFLLLALVMTACVNLKAVNDFAKTSKETVQDYSKSGISLTSSYKELMISKCLYNYNISEDTVVLDKVPKKLNDCFESETLRRYRKSDSLITLVNTVIERYFMGLEELSDNQVTSFQLNADDLETLLRDKSTFPSVNDNHINASKGIVNLLTNASLEAYRQKELAKVINEADESLELVLEMYIAINKDIKEALDIESLNNFQDYETALAAATNDFDKIKAGQAYLRYYNKVQSKIEINESFAKALRQMIEGHKKLVENANKLDTKSLIKVIASYTTDIVEIKNEINKLKQNE